MPTSPSLFRSLNATSFWLSGFVSGLIVLCSLISTQVHPGTGCWNMIISTIGDCRFLMPHTTLISLTPSMQQNWQWKTGNILPHIFPLGVRKEADMSLSSTETQLKWKMESCLAFSAAWDQTWVTPVSCFAAKKPSLIGDIWETSILKLTSVWSPWAWASKVKGKSFYRF